MGQLTKGCMYVLLYAYVYVHSSVAIYHNMWQPMQLPTAEVTYFNVYIRT